MCTLELLKQRFGESSLHFCEVMLKDFGDSRRISSTVTTKAFLDKVNNTLKYILCHNNWVLEIFFTIHGYNAQLTLPPMRKCRQSISTL